MLTNNRQCVQYDTVCITTGYDMKFTKFSMGRPQAEMPVRTPQTSRSAFGENKDTMFHCEGCNLVQRRSGNIYKRSGKLVCGSCKGDIDNGK